LAKNVVKKKKKKILPLTLTVNLILKSDWQIRVLFQDQQGYCFYTPSM